MNPEISPVFWAYNNKVAFQRVGKVYNVYDENGDFICEFKGFEKMCDWMKERYGKDESK